MSNYANQIRSLYGVDTYANRHAAENEKAFGTTPQTAGLPVWDGSEYYISNYLNSNRENMFRVGTAVFEGNLDLNKFVNKGIEM